VKTQSLRKSLKNNRLGVIDCGGSKIALAVFDVGKTPPKLLSSHSVPTQKGKRSLLTQIHSLIKQHILSHSALNWVVGFPGKLVNGIIQEGSANNLSTIPGEFDNCNIVNELKSGIEQKLCLRVINDALLQIQGIIYESPEEIIAELSPIPFIYIGPGTGLGGALAIITNKNTRKLQFIGDSHIYDILLQVNGKRIMAEDIVSGRALVEQSGFTGKDALRNKETLEKVTPILKNMGAALAQLIIQICQGELDKKYPVNKWSNDTEQKASQVRHFFLGGGLLQPHSVGNIITNKVNEILDIYQRNSDIKLHIHRPITTTLTPLKGALLELFD